MDKKNKSFLIRHFYLLVVCAFFATVTLTTVSDAGPVSACIGKACGQSCFWAGSFGKCDTMGKCDLNFGNFENPCIII